MALLPALSKLPSYPVRRPFALDDELPGESLPDSSAAANDNIDQGPAMAPPVPPVPVQQPMNGSAPVQMGMNTPPPMPNLKSPMLGAKAFVAPKIKTPQPPPMMPENPAAPSSAPTPPPPPVTTAFNLPPKVAGITAAQDENVQQETPDFEYAPKRFPKNGGAATAEPTPMEAFQASKMPERPSSKWYQKLAAALAGGAAGYVNAAGRTHISPASIAAAESGILAPGYAGKLEDYQAQQEDLARKANMQIQQERYAGEKEQRLATAEQRKALAADYAAREKARQDELERKEEQATSERQRKAFNTYTDNGKLPVLYRPENEPPVAGWEKVPLTNPDAPKGMAAFIPPRIAPLPKELVPYAAGRYKEGDMVDRNALGEMEKAFRTDVEKKNAQEAKVPGREDQIFNSAIRQVATENKVPLDESKPLLNQLPLDLQAKAIGLHKEINADPAMRELLMRSKNDAHATALLGLAVSQSLLENRKERTNLLKRRSGNDYVDAFVQRAKDDPDHFDTILKEIPTPEAKAAFLAGVTRNGVEIPRTLQGNEKTSADAAKTAIRHMDRIEQLIHDPDLQGSIGPIAGRITEAGNIIGKSITKSGVAAQKEQELVTMLTNALAWEAKTASGGRTAIQLINMLKTADPRISMDMDKIQGAINGVRSSAGNSLAALYEPSVKGQPISGPATKTPAPVQRIVQKNKVTNKYRHSTDGGKTWQDGQ